MTDELDVYLDEFGRGLVDSTQRLRRRRRRRRVATGAAVVIGAAAMAVVLAGVPGGGQVDVIARARAQLTPGRDIIHIVMTTSAHGGPGALAFARQPPTETWSTDDPLRWRMTQRIPPPFPRKPHQGFGVGFGYDGYPIYGLVQYTFADGRLRSYNPARDMITVYPRSTAQQAVPSQFFGLARGSGDPAAQLRAALATGKVVDEGTRVVRGRTVRRLVATHLPGRHGLRFVYDVDPTTFAPVDGTVDLGRITLTFRVPTYERIPLTARTARLLTIHPGPHTKVFHQPRHVPPQHYHRRPKCFTRAAFFRCRAEGLLH